MSKENSRPSGRCPPFQPVATRVARPVQPGEAGWVSILIVGASVAGLRTAQALRSGGFVGSIALLGEEVHVPYDKPPLTKAMLEAGGDGAPIPLLSEDGLAALNVDLHLGVRAVALDPERRIVTTDAGRRLGYEHLVIATGVVPRKLPAMDTLSGVYAVRNADDAVSLRAALPNAENVVAIGAGFIGAEFATAARAYGRQVTVVEAQQIPMAHIVGSEVGALLSELHANNGVELLTGVAFSRFEGQQQVSAVVVDDGRSLPADLVVVGIGTHPATEWLATSGLPIADGIECDEQLRVVGFPEIHAAGDVARWPHPSYGTSVRIEHWTSANEHGAVVAASILGHPIPATPVPYVWSDQYGHRIQIVGRPNAGELALRLGDAENQLVALYADPAGSLIGAVIVDDPRLLLRCRKAIIKRARVDEVELGPRKTSVG
jgi:NADPH-dependent 2,4-dienoyl-CoA reductase/sulfur reductase-like enzyme